MTDKEQQKPMSDERLAEIRERFRRMTPPFQIATVYDAEAGFDLLAEVERSRAREAAAMEIVRAVADGATIYRDREDEYCTQDDNCFWRRPAPGQPVQMVHTDRCIVTKARALLDDHK